MSRQSIAIAIVLLAFSLDCQRASGEQSPPTERTYPIPCEANSFALSGNGRMIWFACKATLQMPWETDSAEARKKKKSPGPPPAASQLQTEIYALEVPSGKITLLTRVEGTIHIAAAPVGAQMVLLRCRGNYASILYEGVRKVAELPINSNSGLCVRSADASTIYFDGTPTKVLDMLGILRLDGLRVSRKKLFAAAAYVSVCAATGHVFTGDEPIPNAKGVQQANTAVEYDGDVKLVRRETKFPDGEFSATCHYVATPEGSHGPIPRESSGRS
jgi:hypothetical protein